MSTTLESFVVYVLYSKEHSKLYIGFTSDLINRIRSHNIYGTKGFTLRYRPWIVIEVTFFEDKISAMRHEKYLKSGKGRQEIHETLLPKLREEGFL